MILIMDLFIFFQSSFLIFFSLLWLIPLILGLIFWLNELNNVTFFKNNKNSLIQFKEYLLLILVIWIVYFIFQIYVYLYLKNNFKIIINEDLIFYKFKTINFFYFNQFNGFFHYLDNNIYFSIDSITCIFLSMIFLVYPLSFIILDHRININNYKYFFYSIYLFCIIITFFLIQNIFFFFYYMKWY